MEREARDRELQDMQDFLWEELEQQFQNIRNAYHSKKLLLNNIVIEKSALYLKVENYIANVEHKSQTELKNIEEDAKRPRRK